jgi:hypothetical protein
MRYTETMNAHPADSRRALAAVLALAAVAGRAGACPELAVAPEVPNGIELQLGATNVNAALGNGRLTAAFSRCGELTVLKWPGPSLYDQLAYLTSNAPDARLTPHLGALDDQGAFAGLAWVGRHGRRGVTWLRDDDWTHRQHYSADTSDVLIDEATNPALGLDVVAEHFVLPDRDVLVSRYTVTRARRSRVRKATLLFYTNFSPTLARLPYFPLADWALDFENDYAAVYDRHARALLHFLPASAQAFPHDFGPVDALLRAPPRSHGALVRRVDGIVAGLAGRGGAAEPGVYIAAGARPRDDGYQVGFDDAPLCQQQTGILERILAALELPPSLLALARQTFECATIVADPGGPLAACRAANGWTYEARNAYDDAADGRLSRSPIAACQANAALARRLHFRRRGATATFDVAVAGTMDAVLDLLRDARAGDPDDQRSATEAWWASWLAPARLPATDDPLVTAFARRSLVVMRTATDAASGAIVASIATQAPYGADWVRDGAFIDHALDVAGYTDLVSRHVRFYARVQRTRPSGWSPLFSFPPCDPTAPVEPDCIPAGTYEMNYYADPTAAVPAGPISFEIDAAGLGVWTMWDHATFLTDPAARAAYLADVCPAIERGAAGLAACRDAATGLPCPANEDDNFPLTQGLQGAETVLLALDSATAAAGACAFEATEVAGWQARATELRAAIHAHFVVPGPPPHFAGGRPAWVLWPVGLLAPSDPLAQSHADWLAETAITPILDRTALGAGYNAESLLARAMLQRARHDAAGLAASQDAVRAFIAELATPGTLHLGEFSGRVPVDLDGDGVAPDYLPENDVPHVWEHAYLYLAAMAAFGAR